MPTSNSSYKLWLLIGRHLQGDYIIVKSKTSHEGYEIVRTIEGGIRKAIRIEPNKLQRIINTYSPLVDLKTNFINSNSEALVTEHVLPIARKIVKAFVQVDTTKTLVQQEEDIDTHISITASHHSCVTISHHGSYLLYFQRATQALECAQALKSAYPIFRIAVAYGSMQLVLRSFGFDYVGTPLQDCEQILSKQKEMNVAKLVITKGVQEKMNSTAKSMHQEWEGYYEYKPCQT